MSLALLLIMMCFVATMYFITHLNDNPPMCTTLLYSYILMAFLVASDQRKVGTTCTNYCNVYGVSYYNSFYS